MKKLQRGFSLIEFLIYFLITQVFLFISMHWSALQVLSIKNQMHTCMRSMGLYAAHDVLINEVRTIDTNKIFTSDNFFVWRHSGVDIGWELDENKLFRCEGIYDYDEHTWTSRRKNLVADSIKTFTAFVHYNSCKKPIGITTIISEGEDCHRDQLQNYTKLRNGTAT